MQAILPEKEGFETLTASNPLFAENKFSSFNPDVLILDLQMPQMDGLTYLKKIMSEKPLPVIICSSYSQHNSINAISALDHGALEIIEKPNFRTKEFIEESKTRIQDIVKAAVNVKVNKKIPEKIISATSKLTADVILPAGKAGNIKTTEKVIVVGASTGGTEALKDFLMMIPGNMPPILIVQHMPKHFTKAFAERLNTLSKAHVQEAVNGMKMKRGEVFVAPGDEHMLLQTSGTEYYIEVRTGPLVSRHRPSVDVLFRSAARFAGKNVIGVIMTGMGDDGARGMKEMKDNGAYTIAQDEKSCIVYGMPKEAVKRGAVDEVLPLSGIAGRVIDLVK
jgi:two-component system chemotaxis response regulator CheB